MKMKNKAVVYALGLLMVMAVAINASATENSGAAFLKIGVGARPIGMGGAFVALANDANAVFWNPAGISQLKSQQIGAMHTQWISDITYDYVGYVSPVGKGAIGISGVYLSSGSMDRRGSGGEALGSFGAYDTSVALSYARQLTGVVHMGINVKLIQQSIEDETANGFAVDIGQMYMLPVSGLSAGIAVQNIGPQMKFIEEPFSLPLTVTAGVGYKMLGGLTLGMDVKHQVVDSITSISVGTEYFPVSMLALRAGYLAKMLKSTDDFGSVAGQDTNMASLTGLGAGVGFKLGSTSVDYAFVPYGDLGNTHRISILASF
ncbi:MAG: PorV/PorQ family protein [bacterium]